MKNSKQLINNAIGQLEGVVRMMDSGKDCFDVIIQMKAARSAVDSAMQKFIQENITSCADFCENGKKKQRMEKLLAALIKK